jgi:hypothetical protein
MAPPRTRTSMFQPLTATMQAVLERCPAEWTTIPWHAKKLRWHTVLALQDRGLIETRADKHSSHLSRRQWRRRAVGP